MSYKRRVGPRTYARKPNPGGATSSSTKNPLPLPVQDTSTPSSTKNTLPMPGRDTSARFGTVTAPSTSMSPQLATMTAITTPCNVLAFGSPYSVSTSTTSDQSLPDTPTSAVSPARPIRTTNKSHKMTGTLPRPSFQGRNSGFLYPTTNSRSVPQPLTISSHMLFTPSDGGMSSHSIGNEAAAVNHKPMSTGLWQSLLGNAGDQSRNEHQQSTQPSPCLFPSLDSPRYPTARASFQPLVTQSTPQAGKTHSQLGMNTPMMHEMQNVRPFAPPSSAPQMMFPGGQFQYSSQVTPQPTHFPSRTLSGSSVSSSNMLMTPPRPGMIKTDSEHMEQSPVFTSFELSLGHSLSSNQVGGIRAQEAHLKRCK
ncbi:hypothetical protein QFC19_000416 [Naganishia cerealis]|uniref:Uncharacterized protein n=1 Tax=Naganishia cerealis TaxID=610337 RepID=A0ACC2WP36_9TREE|nr:hypothetical protein QFC19_000416 [Naganishia cerealis]